MENTISVGVLCIQGAFIEHIHKLTELAKQYEVPVTVTEVRRPDQLSSLDGLIIPGGESTTLSVFLKKNDFEKCLKLWIYDEHKPGVVWGTCAGLILMADELTGQKKGGQITIGGLKVQCSRNVFGRQADSFESPIKLHHPPLYKVTTPARPPPHIRTLAEDEGHGVFIRAPGIVRINDPSVTILATHGEDIVAVQQDHLIATTFHPELTNDTRWHLYFLNQIVQRRK